jgi:RNA polymerase primary sigma factor
MGHTDKIRLPLRSSEHDARYRSAAEGRPAGDARPRTDRPRSVARLSAPRRVAATAPRPASPSAEHGNDATDLYLRGLAQSHPLTREGEAEIGRRIESAEHDALDALAMLPEGLRAIAALADDVAAGLEESHELLLNSDAPEAPGATDDLIALLHHARELVEQAGEDQGALERSALEIARGLVKLRLDPAVLLRVEDAFRAEIAGAAGSDREGLLQETLSRAARARRVAVKAKGDLVQANLRLVVATARHYQKRGVPLLDLVQEGNLGLMRAADKFDWRRGYRFGTYAAWWIRQSIERALLYQGKDVRMPVHLSTSRRKVLHAQKAFSQQNSRDPSQEEIAELSGVPLDKVHAVRTLAMTPVSLDAPVGDEGDARFGDFLRSEDDAPDERLAQRRMLEQTAALLDTLTPREREVLRLRYGLDGENDHTLEEIGKSFSLSRERIRQIESKALAKLRAFSQEKELNSYLDG